MLSTISEELSKAECNSIAEIKAAILKVLESQISEEGYIVSRSFLDVDELIKSLEIEAPLFEPAKSEPVEELKEEENREDDVTPLRPIVREESDDEDDSQEEGEMPRTSANYKSMQQNNEILEEEPSSDRKAQDDRKRSWERRRYQDKEDYHSR